MFGIPRQHLGAGSQDTVAVSGCDWWNGHRAVHWEGVPGHKGGRGRASHCCVRSQCTTRSDGAGAGDQQGPPGNKEVCLQHTWGGVFLSRAKGTVV